jgi:hypothetical protein
MDIDSPTAKDTLSMEFAALEGKYAELTLMETLFSTYTLNAAPLRGKLATFRHTSRQYNCSSFPFDTFG